MCPDRNTVAPWCKNLWRAWTYKYTGKISLSKNKEHVSKQCKTYLKYENTRKECSICIQKGVTSAMDDYVGILVSKSMYESHTYCVYLYES